MVDELHCSNMQDHDRHTYWFEGFAEYVGPPSGSGTKVCPGRPASETPGPGEGDLRGEAERREIHRLLCSLYRVAHAGGVEGEPNIDDETVDFYTRKITAVAAVEQRTLAQQKVERQRGTIANASHALDQGFIGSAQRILRAALADPEADR